MSDNCRETADSPRRAIVSEAAYQQASRQLHIVLANYCNACNARNLLYPEALVVNRSAGFNNPVDVDLYQLVKAKALHFVVETIKLAHVDAEMHRCAASLLLIFLQSLVYCAQQLTLTPAEFELEAMQLRASDDAEEWPKNALKEFLMMDGVSALLAVVYKNKVADIQATAISSITYLVQLSKYAANQLICPVQMFVIAHRDDMRQQSLRRRRKEKRTAPLSSSDIPTGLAVVLAAMKLHRNKYTVSAAVAYVVDSLLDQRLESAFQSLESTQAWPVLRSYQTPHIKILSSNASRSAATEQRWEVLNLCVGFLKRWNRFVVQGSSNIKSSILTPAVVHELILRLVFRLITESKSAAMYIGSQQEYVNVINNALAAHTDKPALRERADVAITLMRSYQAAFAVTLSRRRSPSPSAACTVAVMPDILHFQPTKTRPAAPAGSRSPATSTATNAGSITWLLNTDFTEQERMQDMDWTNHSHPYSTKPSRQELHLERVREVYQNGGPRVRRRPHKPEQRTRSVSTSPVALASSENPFASLANEVPNAKQLMIQRCRTLPQLLESRTSSAISSPANESLPRLDPECVEDLSSLERILGGIGQVRC